MKTIQDFIKHKIEVLDSKYPKAIPVFSRALWVYHGNDFDSERFVNALLEVAEDAKFYNWHESPADAMRRFCHICMMDPVSIEAAMGVKFEALCKG